ncbi:unnamed protein product [Polarella glacialis]|uniref:Peptidase C1A papain C-terminal domain-containing protein n=1 Tax=Polarella glacialis TaxID=89957 RepID=A0A813H0S9_POLGL|nr:unnamed protein product [Polarella glacialis]
MAKVDPKIAAATEALARRNKKGKSSGEIRKYAVYGLGGLVAIFAVYLALTDGSPRKKSGGKGVKENAQVNDRYFISDVTSYAAGNFTAAASPFFNSWSYADVKYGLDGVNLRAEGMIGMPGALQVCGDDDGVAGGAMPPNYDLRMVMPECTTEVYDAGNCSSSYAVAAAGVLSSRFCFDDNEKYKGLQLSPQQIISCDKKSQGCQGGGFDSVWSYISRRGLFPESCVPFAGGKAAACKSDCDQSKKLKSIDSCLMKGGEKEIKREIFNRGPVMAMMFLKDDFLVYSGGVYNPTDNANQQYGAQGEPMMHAVQIIGWGKSEGTACWIVKSSWGKTWGEEGYARVAVGSVIREESAIVPKAATEEAIADAAKKAEKDETRRGELKKERAERDIRIKERERQRAEEKAAQAAAEDDLDFEDEEVDLEESEEGATGEAE